MSQRQIDKRLAWVKEQEKRRRAERKLERAQYRRPVWGTQEWAETRGDDLGESFD